MALFHFYDSPSYYHRPSRMLDQHFGLALSPEDLLEPLAHIKHLNLRPAGYLRPWRTARSEKDYGSTLSMEKDKFMANLDVQQFKPEEITVKLSGDNMVTVEGKHEEKEDEHGYIYRHFVRKYILPKDCDVSRLESKLSSDGVLTITAPKTDTNNVEYKNIPIQQTGEPLKKIENKEEKANK